jgi:tetratricopeptide (TPR) repeat protein
VEVETAVLTSRAAATALLLIVLTGAILFGASPAPRWTLVKSESLTVCGDAPPGALRDVARRLEQFRIALASVVTDARRPLPLPTVVYVFGSRVALQPFLPERGGRPAALRGYFHRDADENAIAMALGEDDESTSIIFHEYAHLLVQRKRPLPIWLNEGLAEYFSTFAVTSRGRTADIGRPIARHVRVLRQTFLPLSQLLAVSASSELYDEGQRRSIFYAEAWALTHYLMVEMADGPALIDKYGALAAEGRPPDQVFEDVFGVPPAEFEPRVRQYVARSSFRSRVYTFSARIEAETAATVRALSQGEADAWLGDLQRRVGRGREAAARIEAAAEEDAKSAQVLMTLGRLRLDQDRAAEAGLALLKATELDPSSADALAWLAYAHMVIGRVPEARAAIARAVALAPERLDYRLRDADVAVLEGNLVRARSVLDEVMTMTADPALAARAQERLDAIARRR